MPSLCRDCLEIIDKIIDECPKCHSHRIVAHKNLENLSIAHIDCDAYFASLHKRDNPELRNVPVIIGGGSRGVVSTACYIARSFGVKSAMPIFQARKLCPNGVFIPPNMQLYRDNAIKIRKLFDELSPAVEAVSIDEAYIDLSGTEKLHNYKPAQTLAILSKRVEKEIGITISIGLSENKFLAKTASDMDKPRGFYILSKEDVPNVLWNREVNFLHGVGKATAKRLQNLGYLTIGDLAHADKYRLMAQIGEHGEWLYNIANGNDNRKVESNHDAKSLSTETTFANDISDFEQLSSILKQLCEKLARSARSKKIMGKIINIKLKTAKFKTITRQVTTRPTYTARHIYEIALELLRKEMPKSPFRLIGIGMSDLHNEDEVSNNDLFATHDKSLDLERAIDKISDKFGKDIFKRF